MFDAYPDPIALTIGPLSIGWYGLGYAVGLAAAYLLLTWLAKRAGEDPELVGNGIIVVAVAALIGGRLYHVIDQWALYANDPLKIILPPYSGLGVYGGIATGIVAVVLITRAKRVSFWRWADIIAPSLFVMQAIARWGNYFNQELYGPPTSLPWGIPIDCAHRIAATTVCDLVPETDALPPAVPVRIAVGGDRCPRAARDRFPVPRPTAPRGHRRHLLHLVRGGAVPAREPARGQLDRVRDPDRPARERGVRHRDRGDPHHAASIRSGGCGPPPSIPGVATWGAIGPNDWKHRPISEPWANLPAKDPFDDDDDPFDDDDDEAPDDTTGDVIDGDEPTDGEPAPPAP